MDGWQERFGRWALLHGGRVIAHVVPDTEGAQVILDCRMAWQVVKGRAGSVAQGKRYAERLKMCAAD